MNQFLKLNEWSNWGIGNLPLSNLWVIIWALRSTHDSTTHPSTPLGSYHVYTCPPWAATTPLPTHSQAPLPNPWPPSLHPLPIHPLDSHHSLHPIPTHPCTPIATPAPPYPPTPWDLPHLHPIPAHPGHLSIGNSTIYSFLRWVVILPIILILENFRTWIYC